MSKTKDCAQTQRELIAECLNVLRIHATLGERFAEIGDDAGLGHAMRRIMALVRAAQEPFAELLKNSPNRQD